MKCPKCGTEDLEQLNPGIDTLQDGSIDASPESTFVVREYNCPKCGKLQMFFDYTRTDNDDGQTLHENPLGKRSTMTLSESKELFEKHHPELVEGIEVSEQYCIGAWEGFKSALKLTGQLEEK